MLWVQKSEMFASQLVPCEMWGGGGGGGGGEAASWGGGAASCGGLHHILVPCLVGGATCITSDSFLGVSPDWQEHMCLPYGQIEPMKLL